MCMSLPARHPQTPPADAHAGGGSSGAGPTPLALGLETDGDRALPGQSPRPLGWTDQRGPHEPHLLVFTPMCEPVPTDVDKTHDLILASGVGPR